MEFRIADTFTDSLSKLSGEEQKGVKTTVFDLQVNPANPGLQFHRLDKARDKRFWSVRVSSDIRLIVHKSESSLLLCFVGHHDDAYDWAEKRKLETHPKTGAAQLVEIRETIQEINVPVYIQTEMVLESKPEPAAKKAIFAEYTEDYLASYGVPLEWISDVKKADENQLLILADHLPAEAAEALIELATGGTPRAPEIAKVENPFEHPDAQRRFRVVTNVEELERALDAPWEKWTIFLHPDQRQWVERDYSGPARVSGSAGTGKTIVAIHRAAHLARTNEDGRVLLTTFSDTLANTLRTKLNRLVGNEPRLRDRIDVQSLEAVGERLYKAHLRAAPSIASRPVVTELIQSAAAETEGHKFSLQFLIAEWEQVVDAWQLNSWEEYRDVARLGRKTRLVEAQRAVLWSVFEKVKAGLQGRKLTTSAEKFSQLAEAIAKSKNPIYDYVVADEAQDFSIAHLRFLATLGGNRPNALFFAGDLGQRIFQQPFSWKSLGVDVRGRSRTLRVNYRTSHQIRQQADRLLGPQVADVDGNVEERYDTVSVFNGPPPTIQKFDSEQEEQLGVAKWISDLSNTGLLPHEFAVIVRSDAQIPRAQAVLKEVSKPFKVLDEKVETTHGNISVCTMHLAKGLEFRAVAVMACDDEIIPLQERIETVTDDSDLEEVYNTERHLLYVAATRARDHLLITAVNPASEFLDDLRT